MPSAWERELEKMDEVQERHRARMRAQFRQRLRTVLSNEAGFARLRAITDEEWEAAVQAGEPVEDAA